MTSMRGLGPASETVVIHCDPTGNKPYWLYVYGWMMLLVVANIVFFILVAIILIKAQNDPLLKRSREYNRERWATNAWKLSKRKAWDYVKGRT